MDIPEWVVTDVEPRRDYTLIVTFITGEKKLFDMRSRLNRRVFAPLANIALFMQAHCDGTSVAWNDEIDSAPETLYDEGIPLREQAQEKAV